jgi:hypothetical protein
VPNPIESSDEGTVWSCRVTGPEVQCTGTFTFSWVLQEGPGDWCAVPLYSVNGTFTRAQTRYYTYDAASGQFLEYKRLIHLYSNEYLTPVPDPNATNVVIGRLNMTWISTFQTPGDLDSRVTQKQDIDTFIKPPNGGLVVLDVGQKTEDLVTAPGENLSPGVVGILPLAIQRWSSPRSVTRSVCRTASEAAPAGAAGPGVPAG